MLKMTKQERNSVPCQYPMCHVYLYLLQLLQTWIIPSNPKTLQLPIMIIYPDKVTSIVHLWQLFHILRLSLACCATPRYFHLPPHYEDYTMKNLSLDTANINAINISTLDFWIWQHFSSNGTPPHLWKLAMFLKFQSCSYTNI